MDSTRIDSCTRVQNLGLPLSSTDKVLVLFWSVLTLLSLVFRSRIEYWWAIAAANACVGSGTVALAYGARRFQSRALRWIHEWAAFPLLVFTYKQLYFIIGPLHGGKDYDQLLIAADRALFGLNPTEWIARFSNPWTTEILQIAYSLFYVIFIILGIEFCRRQDLSQFRYFRFAIVYGFLLSYVAYFFLPAIGPRFTIHDFSRTDLDLGGILLTPHLRWFINVWESVTPGMSNVVAAANAQRDVFPSGHTMMTVVAMSLSFSYGLKSRWFVAALGVLLIIATVYLRYHYVIDLIAGLVLAVLCVATAERLHRRLSTAAVKPAL